MGAEARHFASHFVRRADPEVGGKPRVPAGAVADEAYRASSASGAPGPERSTPEALGKRVFGAFTLAPRFDSKAARSERTPAISCNTVAGTGDYP